MKPKSVSWDIRRKGRTWQKEAMRRWELTPEKIEMVDGKLYDTDEQRLAMLGMLLENVGVDQPSNSGTRTFEGTQCGRCHGSFSLAKLWRPK